MAPIARIWRGTVETARADEYVEYLRGTGIADILATPGNITALPPAPRRRRPSHFQTVSIWMSEQAIEAFSGTKDRTARLEPRTRSSSCPQSPKPSTTRSR